MRLRVFVGRRGLGQSSALVVHIVMALAGTIDAIGPMQAGIEPLRRIGSAFLRGQHVAQLVIEGLSIGLAVEIAALPAPIGPSAGHAVEHLLGGFLAGGFLAVLGGGLLAPQEFRHAFFGHGLQRLGDAGLAEILLRQHVAGHLAPAFGDLDIGLGKDDGTVRVADLAGGAAKRDAFIGRVTLDREMTVDTHGADPKSAC